MTTNEEMRARFMAWTDQQREEFRKRRELDFADDADCESQLDALEERETEQDRAEDVE